MGNMRHECKHRINHSDKTLLETRLSAICERDSHSGGSYLVRSIYFDNPNDIALREKIDGVNIREKFRIRMYDADTSFIRLEKKSKINGLTSKTSAELNIAQTKMLIEGDISWMAQSSCELIYELYSKMRLKLLEPKTIIEYRRDAFIYAPGNVRITIDHDIKTGLASRDFLNMAVPLVFVPDDPIILEVKWDEFLPDIIRMAVQINGRSTHAYSKYAAGRTYI